MGFIQGSNPAKYFPVTGKALAEIIRPLLTLHGLRTLLLVMERIDLEHSSLVFLDMVRSWPHLRELHIELHEENISRADIYTIVYFAEHCPRLRRLRMPGLDVTHDDLARITDYLAWEPHPLQYFALPRAIFRGREHLTSPVGM